MDRLKPAIVDLLVTAFIVMAVATSWPWARWVVLIYTATMLVLKIVAVLGAGRLAALKRRDAPPPRLLIHALYAVNVIALGAVEWWYPFSGWLLIWLLSVVYDRRAK